MADLTLYQEFEISRVTDFNPDTGTSIVITYAGLETMMDTIKAYYDVAGYIETPIGYGYKTQKHLTAAAVLLTVRIPDDILYTEKWQLDSCPTQIPIWRDAKVRNYLEDTLGGYNLATSIGLASFMWRVGLINRGANAMSSGALAENVFTATAAPPPTINSGDMTTEELAIMAQIVREGPYMDWKRPILRRQRYIPSVNVASRTRLVGRAELYSLDGIASVFGIPDDNYDQAVTVYDDLPTAYTNTMWAWKLGRDDSEGIVGAAKVVENKEWTFGMWSTLTNDFIE